MKRREREPIVVQRMPWDFSEDAAQGERGVSRADRMPPEAAEAGAALARMAERGRAVLASGGLDLPEMCRSCAFRQGTVPNRCIDTVADALKCVWEGERPFVCHHPGREDEYCFGYVAARAHAVSIPPAILERVQRATAELRQAAAAENLARTPEESEA